MTKLFNVKSKELDNIARYGVSNEFYTFTLI